MTLYIFSVNLLLPQKKQSWDIRNKNTAFQRSHRSTASMNQSTYMSEVNFVCSLCKLWWITSPVGISSLKLLITNRLTKCRTYSITLKHIHAELFSSGATTFSTKLFSCISQHTRACIVLFILRFEDRRCFPGTRRWHDIVTCFLSPRVVTFHRF